jgi:hypothetical protein
MHFGELSWIATTELFWFLGCKLRSLSLLLHPGAERRRGEFALLLSHARVLRRYHAGGVSKIETPWDPSTPLGALPFG